MTPIEWYSQLYHKLLEGGMDPYEAHLDAIDDVTTWFNLTGTRRTKFIKEAEAIHDDRY